jgi:CubicO group peptidase (beta-lactamase class C family)
MFTLSFLERSSGLSLGEAFRQWIAEPIGMQDFRVEDVRSTRGPESIHSAWRFWISASTTPDSSLGHVGYGYLWWIRQEGGSYDYATGTGGQKLNIDPERRLVAVNRVDTGSGVSRALWTSFGKRVNQTQFVDLIERITHVASN